MLHVLIKHEITGTLRCASKHPTATLHLTCSSPYPYNQSKRRIKIVK